MPVNLDSAGELKIHRYAVRNTLAFTIDKNSVYMVYCRAWLNYSNILPFYFPIYFRFLYVSYTNRPNEYICGRAHVMISDQISFLFQTVFNGNSVLTSIQIKKYIFGGTWKIFIIEKKKKRRSSDQYLQEYSAALYFVLEEDREHHPRFGHSSLKCLGLPFSPGNQ